MAEFLVLNKRKKKNESSIVPVEVKQYSITIILVSWTERNSALTYYHKPNVRCSSITEFSLPSALFLVINIGFSTLFIQKMLRE